MGRRERRRLYRTRRWQRLAARMVERSGHRCARCERVRGDLEVHHGGGYTAARFFDERYLVVLCRACHYEVHRGASYAKWTPTAGWSGAVEDVLGEQRPDSQEVTGEPGLGRVRSPPR